MVHAPRYGDRERAPEPDTCSNGLVPVRHAFSWSYVTLSPYQPIQPLHREHCQRNSSCGEQNQSSDHCNDGYAARPSRGNRLSNMKLNQRGISRVGPEADIEQVAEQWYRPYESIDAKVQEHFGKNGGRHSKPGRYEYDVA